MKMPKDISNKRSQIEEIRKRASNKPNTGTRKSATGLNRQQKRKLQQQGIEGMEPMEATRVIIQTADADIVIEDPQVIKVNQQGMEMYQIVGESEEFEQGTFDSGSAGGRTGGDSLDSDSIEDDEEELTVEIKPEDIQLVAMQAGCTEDVAENALKEANGDLAKAIMKLKTM